MGTNRNLPSQFGQDDLQISGAGISKPTAAPAAGQLNFNFKVVDYGYKKHDDGISFAKNGTIATTTSGIHMGLMDNGGQNNQDMGMNRNIDMAELQELLS